MLRKLLFVAVAVAGLTMAGCGNKGLVLTQAENGGQVEVAVGEQFTVVLPGNPSTGYTWELQNLDSEVFQQVGEPVFVVEGEPMPGAGGTLTLTFKALEQGSAALVLVYHRSWEVDVPPVETFTVTVNVK